MVGYFKSAVLTAIFAVSAAVASASTLTASGSLAIGDDASIATSIAPGGTQSFVFTALQDLRIQNFISVSATGQSSGTSISQLTFGYTGPNATSTGNFLSFINVVPGSTTAFGGSEIPGFVLLSGEAFTFAFNSGSNSTIPATLSFTTAAVPVPAAGLLLLTALIGGGVVARRKKKQAA